MQRFTDRVGAIPREMHELPYSIKQVALVTFIYFLSWGVVAPFLPLFFLEILGSYGRSAFITALMFIFGLVWLFPVGEILDRFSQKRIMRLALLLYIPLFLFLATVQTFFQAVLYQLYHSMLSAGFWSSSDTYTRKNSPEGRRSSSWGLYDSASTLSLVIGAVLGGIALQYFIGIRTLVVLMPAFVIAAFFTARNLPETDLDHKDSTLNKAVQSVEWKKLYIKEIKDFWRNPALRRLTFFIIVVGFLTRGQGVLLPFLSDAVGASYIEIGVVFALFVAPLLSEAPFSVVAELWSRRTLMIIATLIAAVALVGLSFSQDPVVLFPLALLLGLAAAIMIPIVSGAATDAMERDHMGELNAVYAAVFSVGGILGMVVLGPLIDIVGIHAPFALSAVILFCATIAVFLFWEKDTSQGGIKKTR